jgi:hypothetical protein
MGQPAWVRIMCPTLCIMYTLAKPGGLGMGQTAWVRIICPTLCMMYTLAKPGGLGMGQTAWVRIICPTLCIMYTLTRTRWPWHGTDSLSQDHVLRYVWCTHWPNQVALAWDRQLESGSCVLRYVWCTHWPNQVTVAWDRQIDILWPSVNRGW